MTLKFIAFGLLASVSFAQARDCTYNTNLPTQAEIVQAAQAAHVLHLPNVGTASCFHDKSGTLYGVYEAPNSAFPNGYILLASDWRDAEGTLLLVHEMEHAAQDQSGGRLSHNQKECQATTATAGYARRQGWESWARREERYGFNACVGAEHNE